MKRVLVRIRPLADYGELESCVDLQKATWGALFDDVVSAALMQVSQKIGGVSAGAFDPDGRLVGTIFGLTGIREDEPVHWSHMLAVKAEWQGRGVGTFLKAYQRRRVMQIGASRMYWTFDPLESRNAHFNLNRLGARISEYVRDMYGSGASSSLHRGIGTDRFVVVWHLGADRVRNAMQRLDAAMSWNGLTTEAALELPIDLPNDHVAENESPAVVPERDDRTAIVEIPSDIQRLKAERPDQALSWRKSTRAALTKHLADGFEVIGFKRDRAAERCFYVLAQMGRPASSTPSADSSTR